MCPFVLIDEVDDVVKDTPLFRQTLQAEKLLLGCILREPLALLAARPLPPGDLSSPAHALVLATLRQLEEDGLPIDLPTLTTRLERSGQLARVGGPAFLADLARSAPAQASMPQAAELTRRILAGRAARTEAGAVPESERARARQTPPHPSRLEAGATGGRPLVAPSFQAAQPLASTEAGATSSPPLEAPLPVAPPSLATHRRAIGPRRAESERARGRQTPPLPAGSRRYKEVPGAPPTLAASSVAGDVAPDLTPAQARARLEAQAPTLLPVEALLRQSLPPTLWIIPDLLPEGLTLLAAKPKLGKSWMALGLALAVAAGGTALGELAVEPGAVLYLALEDSPKRLRQRAQQLLRGAEAPTALEVATEWPRLDMGGLDLIELWLQTHPKARLVILDTLAKIRGAKSVGSYAEDYASLEAAQALAQRAGVGILVIHHTGKESRDDALDEVNATQGLNGVADNILVLRRPRGKLVASLIGDGRELNGLELALLFDPATGAWSITEPPEEEASTTERTEVLRILKASAEPMSAGQIAEAVGKTTSAVNRLLTRMAQAGEISRKGYGLYIPPSLSELSE